MRRFVNRKQSIRLQTVHKLAHAFASTTFTTKYNSASIPTATKEALDNGIRQASCYPDMQTAINDFLDRVNSFKSDKFLTDDEKIFNFFKYTCDINLEEVYKHGLRGKPVNDTIAASKTKTYNTKGRVSVVASDDNTIKCNGDIWLVPIGDSSTKKLRTTVSANASLQTFLDNSYSKLRKDSVILYGKANLKVTDYFNNYKILTKKPATLNNTIPAYNFAIINTDGQITLSTGKATQLATLESDDETSTLDKSSTTTIDNEGTSKTVSIISGSGAVTLTVNSTSMLNASVTAVSICTLGSAGTVTLKSEGLNGHATIVNSSDCSVSIGVGEPSIGSSDKTEGFTVIVPKNVYSCFNINGSASITPSVASSIVANGYYAVCDDSGIRGNTGLLYGGIKDTEVDNEDDEEAKEDNSIIGRTCGIPGYVDIITDTTFKDRRVQEQVPDFVASSKSFNVASVAGATNYKTAIYDRYTIADYESSISTVMTKDYGVDLYLMNGKNGKTVVHSYDECDSDAKHFFRWMCSKLPIIYKEIEEATGLSPGYPYYDRRKGSRRILLWNGNTTSKDICIAGFVDSVTSNQQHVHTIKFPVIAESKFKVKSYSSFTKQHYIAVKFIAEGSSSASKDNDIKLLANNGGFTATGAQQTWGNTLQHESMHYVQFLNMRNSTNIYPTWFKEGWAELIRGDTYTARVYNNSYDSDFGTWGLLFFNKSVGDDGATHGFKNVLEIKTGAHNQIYSHIDYAAGFAFWKFLIKSITHGWDARYSDFTDNIVNYDSNSQVQNSSHFHGLQKMREPVIEKVTKAKPYLFIKNYYSVLKSYRHCHNEYDVINDYYISNSSDLVVRNAALKLAMNGFKTVHSTYSSALASFKDAINSSMTSISSDINSKGIKFLKNKCTIDFFSEDINLWWSKNMSGVDDNLVTKEMIIDAINSIDLNSSTLDLTTITDNKYGPYKVYRLSDKNKKSTPLKVTFTSYYTVNRDNTAKANNLCNLDKYIICNIVRRYIPLILDYYYTYWGQDLLDSDFIKEIGTTNLNTLQSINIRFYYAPSSGIGATTFTGTKTRSKKDSYYNIYSGHTINANMSYNTGHHSPSGYIQKTVSGNTTTWTCKKSGKSATATAVSSFNKNSDIDTFAIFIDFLHEFGHVFANCGTYRDRVAPRVGVRSESYADLITPSHNIWRYLSSYKLGKGGIQATSDGEISATTYIYSLGKIFMKYLFKQGLG